MSYEFNFGRVGAKPPERAQEAGSFRLAVLGDFSGRANAGSLETGAELARRKPIKLDFDNIDGVLQRFGTVLRLPLAREGGSVEIRPSSVDDLHPDALYENLELFEELAGLRQRLESGRSFQAAADEVRAWRDDAGEFAEGPKSSRRSRGAAVPVDAKLSDFARLVGKPTVALPESTPADELLRQVVTPYLVQADDPDQDELIATVDRVLSETMRLVLHHPDFQALESAWRSLDFLVRRIETSARLQIVLYDISAEEFAADLSAHENLEDSGLYQLLVEQPALDAHQGSLSALIATYAFEMTPPHAELLGRMATIASQAQAPFVAALGPDCIDTRTEDLHPLVVQSWNALRGLGQSQYLGLVTPRFLLRTPYGAKTEAIEPFEFEEFDRRTGLRGLLWGNGAVLAGVLLAEHYVQQGGKISLGKVLSLGDMPYFFYTDTDGEQVALPCTERLLTEKKAAHVTAQNLIPVLAIKGRPDIRLGGFRSVAGVPLAGFWTPPEQLLKPTIQAVPTLARLAEAPQPAVEAAPAIAPVAEPEEVEAVDAEPEVASAVAEESAAPEIPETAEEAPADDFDADLDALLAQLSADDAAPEPAAEDEEMDPELAALLAEL
jgi:type VI secretion system protein ImpC